VFKDVFINETNDEFTAPYDTFSKLVLINDTMDALNAVVDATKHVFINETNDEFTAPYDTFSKLVLINDTMDALNAEADATKHVL
jgi:hypothetical protein